MGSGAPQLFIHGNLRLALSVCCRADAVYYAVYIYIALCRGDNEDEEINVGCVTLPSVLLYGLDSLTHIMRGFLSLSLEDFPFSAIAYDIYMILSYITLLFIFVDF